MLLIGEEEMEEILKGAREPVTDEEEPKESEETEIEDNPEISLNAMEG